MRTKPLISSLLALASATALAACASSSGADGGSIGIGYFQSATIGPEVLVAGNPDLRKKVDGQIRLTPMDSGVAGLAELRGGAFPFASGVGNPPVVGAIAKNTKLKVVYAEDFDAAELVVGPDITSNRQLAGKTIGDLEGSSEDFEIRGWLDKQGLAGRTKVVSFPSQDAAAAAFKAHRIDAAYVEVAQALDLKKHDHGRSVVTAQQIAQMGIPSLNVLAVTDKFASQKPQVVQQVVCQVMHAQTLSPTGRGTAYIQRASSLVGATPKDAVAATKAVPYVPAGQQLSWLKSSTGDVSDSKIGQAYKLTAKFLKDQGRVTSLPTDKQIASHIDASYAEKALKQGCAA